MDVHRVSTCLNEQHAYTVQNIRTQLIECLTIVERKIFHKEKVDYKQFCSVTPKLNLCFFKVKWRKFMDILFSVKSSI